MSTRDELIARAAEGWINGGLDPENLVEARKLVDAYAHELAERIREVRDAYDLPEHHKIHGALDYAADLIDPEVTP